MQKKSIFVILGVMLAVVVASLSLVFAVGPRVGADSEVVLNQESHFKIDGSHRLTGISDAHKSLINGKNFRVVIPSSVTSIGNSAFAHCSGLTSIEIPSGVTSIGNSAFWDCSGLTSITIPSSVTSIGCGAFDVCSGLTTVTFAENSQLTSIGDDAFYGCSGLTSIEIPSSVTSIGNRAFCYCSNLTSIEIPSSVTRIGNYAFCYCSGLTSIEIPSSVTSIGKLAFDGCSGLTTITVDEANPNYYSNGGNCIVERLTNTLIAGCQNTVIPSSVTSVNIGAFDKCSGLTSIEIPSSVTSIGSNVFYECSGLTTVTFAENSQLTSIGDYVFAYCSGLTSIEIPSSVTSIGDDAFYGCSGLTEIIVRDPALMNDSELTQYGSKLHYGADQNTVEFVTNCATTVDNRTVDFGATTTEPTLQKEHYHLVGWYRDEVFTQPFTFDTPIKYNTTLYAKWEEGEETPDTLGENDTNKFNQVIAWVGGGIAVTLSSIAVAGIVVAKKRRK